MRGYLETPDIELALRRNEKMHTRAKNAKV
jgi:hypothetical protein